MTDLRNVLFVGLPEVQGRREASHDWSAPLHFVGDGGQRSAGVRGPVQGGVGGRGGVVVHSKLLLDVWQWSEAGVEAGVAQVDSEVSHGAGGRQQSDKARDF